MLTANQIAVVAPAAVASVTAQAIAAFTPGTTKKQVVAVANGLVRKGLLTATKVGGATHYAATEAGAAALAEAKPEAANVPPPSLPEELGGSAAEDAQPDVADEFAAAWGNMRAGGASKCKALRHIAHTWPSTRKAFIAAAEGCGVNRATASTQWQLGRTGAL